MVVTIRMKVHGNTFSNYMTSEVLHTFQHKSGNKLPSHDGCIICILLFLTVADVVVELSAVWWSLTVFCCWICLTFATDTEGIKKEINNIETVLIPLINWCQGAESLLLRSRTLRHLSCQTHSVSSWRPCCLLILSWKNYLILPSIRLLADVISLFVTSQLCVTQWHHQSLKSPVDQSDIVLLHSLFGGNPPVDDHFLLRENTFSLFPLWSNKIYFHNIYHNSLIQQQRWKIWPQLISANTPTANSRFNWNVFNSIIVHLKLNSRSTEK